MSLPGCDDTDTTQVMTAGYHTEIAGLELEKIDNFAAVDIITNGIVNLDQWIGIADCTAIMCYQIWNTFWSGFNLLDFAELVLLGRRKVTK